MFKKEKKQYINIIKNDKQIRLEGQTFINHQPQKAESTTFLAKEDGTLSHDLIMKLQIMEKNIPLSYISTITSNPYQQVVPKQSIDENLHASLSLNDQYSIIIPKNEIETIKHRFANQIDNIFSPFTLLYEQTAAKAAKNSLNILIKDNKLFVILFDQNKDIKLSTVSMLTPFEDIQNSQFYQDDISGQKLYDEVYFLEIQQVLSDLIQNYYQQFDDTEFIEEVNILYTINQLSDEQLDSLHEALMAKVNYYYISFEEKLKILSQKLNVQDYSFIPQREKKEPKNIALWAGLAAASLILAGGVLYYKSQDADTKTPSGKTQAAKEVKPDETKKKQPKPEAATIKLPSHTKINDTVLQEILTIFDIIPYDAVLKELLLDKNDSTIVCNFIADSTSPEDMRLQLEKMYESSKVILSHRNEAVLSSIITNENKIRQENINTAVKPYTPYKYVSIEKMKTYLQGVLPKDSHLEFLKKSQNGHTTYRFTVSANVKTPKEFFNIIGELNKKEVPINIDYPIEFSKLNDAINVKFNMQYHQKNKTVEAK